MKKKKKKQREQFLCPFYVKEIDMIRLRIFLEKRDEGKWGRS